MFCQGFGGLSGNGIGIRVEYMSLAVVRQGCQHGDNPLTDKHREQVGIHRLYIPNETVIHLCHRTFLGAYNVHVGSRKSQRIYAECLQSGNDAFIHKSTVHHRHHTQSRGIRHPSSVHHPAFYA